MQNIKCKLSHKLLSQSNKPNMEVQHLRIWILILTTVSLTLVVGNILSLQFTIICMLESDALGQPRDALNATNDPNLNITHVGDTCSPDGIHYGPRLKWSPTVQSTIYSAFAWGSLLATLPISWLLQHYGTRRILSIIGFLSAAATVLSPLAAYEGFVYFIACRIVLGVSYTALFPAIGAITTHWATLKENGLFMGMLGSATQLAPVIAMPISGLLCSSSLGWASVFYVHGAITLVVFSAFAALYRDTPRKHPLISQQELLNIDHGKPALVNREDPPVPYRAIAKSIPIWAALAAAFSNMCGSQLVLLFTPTYLTKVLGFDISSVAFLSTLPTLFQFFVKFLGGYASDLLPLSSTATVKIFNSLALFGMAVFLVFLAIVPPSSPYLALSMLVCSMAALGFHSGGFFKSVTLLSMEFAPIVMGLVSLTDTLVWLLAPFVVAAVAPTGSADEWANVFYGTAGLLVLTGIIFIFFGSGETAEWALSPAQKLSMGIHVQTQETFLDLGKEMKEMKGSSQSLTDPEDPEIESLIGVTIKI